MVLQVLVDLDDQVRVVRTGFIQPKNSGSCRGACAGDCKLDPVTDRDVLDLAGTPNVSGRDLVLDQNGAASVDYLDCPSLVELKGLVMAAVFLSGLGHESHVRDGAHGGRVEGTVCAAVVNSCLVDAGVAAVREHGEGVVFLPISSPHVS